MAFTEPTESINAFLNDFAHDVSSGGVNGKGILNEPSEIVAGDLILSTEYQLTTLTSKFGNLLANTAITVNNINYTVREVRKMDDGLFCTISLQKT
tara:strand:+ start:169 stop:456 length:288 start_codon:yes stop_codon:yes gene_type:complete